MKKTLLTLLGSSAMIFAVSTAHAADATVAAVDAPQPGNYVQVCDAYGSGFFFIPGTETCLKIGGEVSFSAGYDSFQKKGFAGADARVSLETKQDSELGTIGSKITFASKANFDAYYLGLEPVRTNDIQEAYITVGPAFVGYKDTLFNTDILYGDFGLNDRFNSTSVGFLQKGLMGGYYAGLSLESYRRGEGFLNENTVYTDDYYPDVIARGGLEADWGTADVSAAYSDYYKTWVVKATGDVKASDAIDLRLTAAYGGIDADSVFVPTSGFSGSEVNGWLVGGSAKYKYSDMFSVFAGAGYADAEHMQSVWAANGGVTVTPAANLDVTGQVTYIDGGKDDDFNTKLIISRKF
jgi:hypothetical protein